MDEPCFSYTPPEKKVWFPISHIAGFTSNRTKTDFVDVRFDLITADHLPAGMSFSGKKEDKFKKQLGHLSSQGNVLGATLERITLGSQAWGDEIRSSRLAFQK